MTALSLMAGVTPAQAASHPASLSAAAAPLTVLTHNTVVIAGTVTPRGSGTVSLQRYAAGKWVPVTHKSAAKSGAYSFAVHTSGTAATTIYRVSRAASGGVKALVSKTMHVHVVKTAFKVKAVSRPSVASATPIVVTGSVANHAKGFVLLEVLQHGVWSDIATGRLTSASTFSFSHVLPSGSYALRVRKPYSTTIASGVSPSVKVTVTAPTTAAPSASVSLSGRLASPGVYNGSVTATANLTAAAGLKSATYVLDGAAAKPYTAALVVTTVGSHTLEVTVTDRDLRTATATATWAIAAAQGDLQPPTATISLDGTGYAGSIFAGSVAVSIASADTGGSGIRSVVYSLDGAAAATYAGAAFTVSALGNHSVTVTVTDNAGNVGTATKAWTQQAADVGNPTAAVTLSGTQSGSNYTSDVTASVAATPTAQSGIKSVTYSLDGGAETPYTAPIVVTTHQTHELDVTVTDQQDHFGSATKTWTQTSTGPDHTPPTIAIDLFGTGSAGNYTGDVTVTGSANDTGSGVASLQYNLDGGGYRDYTAPFTVTGLSGHSVTFKAIDVQNNQATLTKTWTQTAGTSLPLAVTSDDQATLGLKTARLVFSSYRGGPATAARLFTLTNTTAGTINVSGISIGGADASSFRLSTGQATSFALAGGASATVSVEFHATDPTGCPSSASPYAIGNVNRNATLLLNTDAAGESTASADLSGVNACFVGGNDEPVLEQVIAGLGYADNVYNGFDHRYIGPGRTSYGDEIQSPYFVAANGAAPVSLVPIAHYGTPQTTAAGYQNTGWYSQTATMAEPSSTCNSSCKQIFNFPPDDVTAGVATYNQNQKLLPTPDGVTTFTPTGAFGLFSGEYSDVNFSDDSLNVGNQNSGTGHTANTPLPVPHYLHDLRIYPAYGPGHVLIANTYIVAVDLSRVPAYKNNDYQDVVLLLSNAMPANGQSRILNGSSDSLDLTSGVSVSSNCAVTGFDGVMPASGAGVNPCNAGNIATSPSGLVLTSSSGQLATHDQQNALIQTFDATRGAFTISTTVVGSTDQLTQNYRQIGAFFGPDDNNFIKIEAEHNGTAGLTLFWDENGVSSSAAAASPPGLTSSSTLQLVIKGNTNVADPIPYGDEYGVSGYPLDELTVWYSIDGGTLTQIGPKIEYPANVTNWFSHTAKAGILVASPGGATPITATFSQFSITAG